MKTNKSLLKARRANAKQKRQCRTFAGYIGLLNGRPDVDVWPNNAGHRVVHLFLSERKARRVYDDVALVTVRGVWRKAART